MARVLCRIRKLVGGGEGWGVGPKHSVSTNHSKFNNALPSQQCLLQITMSSGSVYFTNYYMQAIVRCHADIYCYFGLSDCILNLCLHIIYYNIAHILVLCE